MATSSKKRQRSTPARTRYVLEAYHVDTEQLRVVARLRRFEDTVEAAELELKERERPVITKVTGAQAWRLCGGRWVDLPADEARIYQREAALALQEVS